MILQFPQVPLPGQPAVIGATKFQIWRGRVRESFGRFLNQVGAPGAIGNIQIKDEATGQRLEVDVGHLFVRITVNGRDFYFNRVTGKFDGTGSACC